jgi:hypothetical protein
MKTSPGILKVFVPMVAIAVMLLNQSCCQFALTIGHGVYGIIIRRPVPIISEAALAAVLDALKKPGVKYHFHLVRNDGSHRDFDFESSVTIKTDRVIMTELAQNLSKDGLTPIGSSLTHHGSFTRAADVVAILNQVNNTE